MVTTLMVPAGDAFSQVTIDSSITGNARIGFGAQTHIVATDLDASGSDKMVVAVSTEHNFGGTSQPSEPVITFGDDPLTLVVSQTSETSGRVSIFYLDNPGTGDLVYQETGGSNGSAWTVLLLSNTLEGVGASSGAPGDTANITVTSGGSFVLSALMTDGPTVTGTPIDRPTADEPQTEIAVEAWNPGREYGVQGTASQTGGPVGSTVTATWTNPNTPDWGSAIAMAEFLSATGGSGGLEIREISVTPARDEVTLTWPKTGALSYVIKASPDLLDWGTDLDDGITDASDTNPADPDHITVTLPLAGDLAGSEKLFFRVEIAP